MICETYIFIFKSPDKLLHFQELLADKKRRPFLLPEVRDDSDVHTESVNQLLFDQIIG